MPVNILGEMPLLHSFAQPSILLRLPMVDTPNGWDYTTGFRNAYGLGVGSSDQLNAEVNPGSYAIPGDILFLSTGKSLTTKVLPSKTD